MPIRMLFFLLFLCASALLSTAQEQQRATRRRTSRASQNSAPKDTIPARYKVGELSPQKVEDLNKHPMDLRNPSNVTSDTTYNEKENTYTIGSKLGGDLLDVPLLMTQEEYARWHMNRSLQRYYREKNKSEFESQGKEKFDFSDMKFDLGPAEKLFGPGGVRIKTQGTAEMRIGFSMKTVDNPSLPQRSRKTNSFDFDEVINLNVKGSVGDKMNLDFNYNTEATFNYDTKKISLKYEGKEDEVIKLLEAGNVSFGSNSGLIKGATSLFGIRADMQFGRLDLQTVISQKTSSTTVVSSKGGTQLTTFDIDVVNYSENRHFFLAHYFRDNYDKAMSQLPTIVSGITINRVEVWVTNKTSNYTSPRNIVAFTDIGETNRISNDRWMVAGGASSVPYNNANDLYQSMNTTYSAIRNIDQVNSTFQNLNDFNGGMDYEKVSNSRLLGSSEYTLNDKLGYISLRNSLKSDEVLAIAFEYTYGGKSYQVGEFSSDQKDSNTSLFVKLLKPNACSPHNGCWNLMMKNVYSIGARNLKSTDFKLDIYYASDELGTNITYIPENVIKNKPLIQVLNLDRLDANNTKENPNGVFDFIEGYTVQASTGSIFFPSVEPFGSFLKKKINNDAIAQKYIFQELYDSTKTIARQIAEKDKFYFIGEYTGSSANVIQTGSYNIPRGSVTVTAGGVTLAENSDYTVDYAAGIVTILNQNIIDAGTAVQVSLESNTLFNMQRKTMLGLNWRYNFSDNFNFGGTLMTLNEKPLTSKVDMGSEPLSNTIWGFNMSWKKQSQWLTTILDKFPLLSCSAPSQINLTADFARLEAGTSSQVQSRASYIDDFESTEYGVDINIPSAWTLSSIPTGMPNYNLTNNILTGYDRALVSWYTIDPLFTRRSSSLTPSHIKSDLNQLSNHYIREVYERELYPNKESTYGESSTLPIMNVSYYPNERGPYNLDPDLTYDGKLNNPTKRWGGITRQLTTTDFETANIQYVEFWLLDPFIYDESGMGGDFYINLGEVSEDILKDGKKFFENGLPASGNTYGFEETAWGRVPTASSLVYAFDNNNDSRRQQDVGLNGLSSDNELTFDPYASYIESVRSKIAPTILDSIMQDPAGDNYHYFRGADYDAALMNILDRYKRFNNTEGNSPSSSGENYNSAAKTTPDIEDANQDFTLDEYENYFQYKISLRPGDMQVGRNFISDKRNVTVKLRNGSSESVDWYKFRIPIDEYHKVVGTIRDFTSVRFMRMYMTQFAKPVTLRFASLKFIRGDWRPYMQAIASSTNTSPSVTGDLTMSAVNIEEHGDRSPVNYVLPPGISRIIDPEQPQLRQDNEQALSLSVTNLGGKESRGVYKKSTLDIRQYERIQMFVHAEALENEAAMLQNNDMSLFIRLGSDYKNNYYEYEIPLTLTPAGSYDTYSAAAARAVWPTENMLDISLSKLTGIKVNRNTYRNNNTSGVSNTTIYSEYDADVPKNKISIIGNPSLGQVKVMMIGLRNNTGNLKSATVWINEMRLLGFNNKSGWAAQGNLNVKLSDVGSIDLQGKIETAGFGGLEEKLASRRNDDYYRYSFTGTFDFGRFFPTKAKVSLPFYYSQTQEVTTPLYSPFETDLLLDDVLDTYKGWQKDSIKDIAEKRSTILNYSLSNAKVNINSKTPMPYDPANFSFSYSYSHAENSGSTIDWERKLSWKATLAYGYTNPMKTIKPFKGIKSKSKWWKILQDFGINPLPQSILANTDMTRTYYEIQTRDLNAVYGQSSIPISFSQQFYWNRAMTVKWDPTTDIRMTLSTGTNAEIEEPYLPVNKDRFPNEYAIWKDSVQQSLRNLGRPLSFQQNFSASFVAPLNKIPVLEWFTADANFNSSYNWARGNQSSGINYGNTIANKRNIAFNGKLDLEKFYNMFPYLNETNKRFTPGANKNNKNKKAPKVKPYTAEITLRADTSVVVVHSQNSKKLTLNARTKKGKSYKVKYKVIDPNTILIRTNDTIPLRVTVVAKPESENSELSKQMQYPTRFLMMLRNFSVTYNNGYAMSLPGFIPNVGDMFGQNTLGGMYAPGLDFAFGLTGDNYLQKAFDRGWLLCNDSVSVQAASTASRDLQVKMLLEPFSDFKIDLNASWTKNSSRSIQYMYDGMPETQSGGFSMTTITIGSSFDGSNAKNNYRSSTYNKFLSNLETIRSRVEQRYAGSIYPESSSLAGQPYDPANGAVDRYSSEVMIPAFLSAYTGGNSGNSLLDLFPSFLNMLPNWNIRYGGLSRLLFFQKYFKSFNLIHGYKSVYAVGSFSTYATYMEYMNGIGFVENASTGVPIPSGRFNIGSVSINESFSPLIGVDMTMHNNLNVRLEFKKTRVLSLSMTALQMVETYSNDFIIGLGYKIMNLKLFGAGSKASKANKVSNDLNLRADFSLKNQTALCRSIDQGTTQATSGNKSFNYSLSADYAYSKMLTLSFYFDRNKTIPLISASAYPTTTTDFGVSLKFSLTR